MPWLRAICGWISSIASGAASFNAASRLTGEHGSRRVWRSFVAEQRALLDELGSLAAGLSDIAAPTVIINGETDHLVDPGLGRNLAETIPSANWVLLPSVGHLLPHDAPEAIADAVRDVHARADQDRA